MTNTQKVQINLKMEINSEIFSKRLIVAYFWNMILQVCLVLILIFLSEADFLHPYLWITSTFQQIFSWRMLLNVLILGLVFFLQAYIYGSCYVITPPKHSTRFSMLLNMLTVQNAIFGIVYAFTGYCSIYVFSSLIRTHHNSLKKNCVFHDGQCVMEESLFFHFEAMWVGLFYFMDTHLFNNTMPVFPKVFPDKLQQIITGICTVMSIGFRKSLIPVACSCVLYFKWGSVPRQVVADMYGLYLEDPPLDNIINLFSNIVSMDLWFHTSLFFTSAYIMRMVFNIVLTEPYTFPIVSETTLTLEGALAQRSRFNCYLGALDLNIMSMTDAKRRSEVFNVSRPGGHPKNWNAILRRCLGIIREFTKDLESVNGDTRPGQNSYNREEFVYTTQYNRSYSSNLRNMALSPKLIKYGTDQGRFYKVLKHNMDLLLQKICKMPGIRYMFGELPDTKLKHIFLHVQPVIWTCEGLAYIAAASLTEDKYGVVQKDLPDIISALVNLKESLDNLPMPDLAQLKYIMNETFAFKMRVSLLFAVKISLYKMAIKFSKYINDIPLQPDIKMAFQQFVL